MNELEIGGGQMGILSSYSKNQLRCWWLNYKSGARRVWWEWKEVGGKN